MLDFWFRFFQAHIIDMCGGPKNPLEGNDSKQSGEKNDVEIDQANA